MFFDLDKIVEIVTEDESRDNDENEVFEVASVINFNQDDNPNQLYSSSEIAGMNMLSEEVTSPLAESSAEEDLGDPLYVPDEELDDPLNNPKNQLNSEEVNSPLTESSTEEDLGDPLYVPDEELGVPLNNPKNQLNVNTINNPESNINKANNRESESGQEDKLKTRSRKRQRNPDNWKKNIRKRRRQHGHSYESSTGNIQTEKKLLAPKKDCQGKCRFKCGQNITEGTKEEILNNFWSKSDTEKYNYYCQTVERGSKQRKRTNATENRKKFSYAYHLYINGSKVRVCKEFYLSTLRISQRRISYYFENINDDKTSQPKSGDRRGKLTPKKITEKQTDFVKDHIQSFPKVESHYCRASSKKEYLDQNLNISIMYRLYLQKCESEEQTAVKEYKYREIFNSEFNLDFHTPKKDRCDRCEEYRMKEKFNLLDEDLKDEISKHTKSKIATKEERDKDRKGTDLVVCFDLENVLSCPRANVSSFFYKRKLSVYNLTAHCSADSGSYCTIWNEAIAGRGANEIASGLVAILEQIYEKHKPVRITLWSDSCVPQNRNCGMSFALSTFLRKHPDIERITHKYCEPGHSSIQEVDSIHSVLENQFSSTEVFSPLAVVRCIKKTYSKNPMTIIQMKPEMFYKYIDAAKNLKYNEVPYTQVKCLTYVNGNPFDVGYKKSFSAPEESAVVSIRPRMGSNRRSSQPQAPTEIPWPRLKVETTTPVLSKEKVADIKSMLKYMPPVDQKFMSGLLK